MHGSAFQPTERGFVRGLLIVGVFVFVLILAEFVGRWGMGVTGGPQPASAIEHWQTHPFLPFVGRESATYQFPMTDGGIGMVANNAFGFRTSEFPLEQKKADDEIRVLCFGGTDTWGTNAANNDDTWPGRLGKQLSERFPDRQVRVFNFGALRAASAYSAVSMSLLGSRLEPDAVVVLHDLYDEAPARTEEFRTDAAHYLGDLHPEATGDELPFWVPDRLRGSALVRWLLKPSDRPLTVEDVLYPVETPLAADANTVAARMRENLITIHSVAVDLGATVLFATPPSSGTAEETAFAEALGSALGERKLDWVDLADLAASKPGSQDDEGRLTEAGLALVADAFTERLDFARP